MGIRLTFFDGRISDSGKVEGERLAKSFEFEDGEMISGLFELRESYAEGRQYGASTNEKGQPGYMHFTTTEGNSFTVGGTTSIPQEIINAVDGDIAAPMETDIDVSFVWCEEDGGSCAGSVVFQFYAMVATSVTFGFEVLAPDGTSDSFKIEVDQRGAVDFHLGVHNAWTWRAFTEITAVEAGLHTLTVHGREDGTKLARVRIEAGDATFRGPSFLPPHSSFLPSCLPSSLPLLMHTYIHAYTRVCQR